MRKTYMAYVNRYDYFDYDNKYHKSGYEYLGSTAKEALKNYKKLKSFDYNHGDSWQETNPIEIIWEFEKPINNHNFFTKENDRIINIPILYDGDIIKIIKNTPHRVKEELRNNFNWEYDEILQAIISYYEDIII